MAIALALPSVLLIRKVDYIAGNLISLCVIYKTDLGFKTSFSRLIASLCIFDTLCILSNLTIFSLPLLSESYRHQVFPNLVPTLLPLAQISLTTSVYTIVAVAVERYITVKRWVGYNMGLSIFMLPQSSLKQLQEPRLRPF